MPDVRSPVWVTASFYLPAGAVFLAALVIWTLSQTGGPLCEPEATFQWHGVWHWLSGVTALLLYFYWRYARR